MENAERRGNLACINDDGKGPEEVKKLRRNKDHRNITQP